jgi:hypothetical protein
MDRRGALPGTRGRWARRPRLDPEQSSTWPLFGVQKLMNLSERLKVAKPTFAQRARTAAPKGWEPGVRFDADAVQHVTTDAISTLDGEPDWREAIASMGVTIPHGYKVRLSEMRYDPAVWTRDTADQENAVTKAIWRYRFIVEPETATTETAKIDGIEILNKLKRSTKPRRQLTGPGSMVIGFSDTQSGKTEGGGTPALLERLDTYFDLAREQVKANRKQVGDLVILLGGDLVEGCNIFPNQVFQIDQDRRSQIRTMTGVVLDMLDRLAPEFSTVRILSVGGNHGENRANGKRVNRHDNDDSLVAEAAAMAASRDPALDHVAFNIATDQAAMTMDVQGHILGLTHGSVFGKTPGNPSLKAYNWFKNQAAGRTPIGDSDLLVTAHFHHEQIVNWGKLLWTQLPAMDGGSPEFSEYSGTDAPAGMATWVMNEQQRMTGYEVLR